MTTNSNDCLTVAKQIAREAILEVWPSADEADLPTEKIYEFDAIYVDDECSEVESVAIMHDPDVNTFALVDVERQATSKQAVAHAEKPSPMPAWPIDWERLQQVHEIAFLRGDLVTSSPESYTIDEMREISDAMDASTAEVEAALRADFNSMTPYAQGRMLDLLKKTDPNNYEWWILTLIGAMPNSLGEISIGKQISK